MSDDSSDIAIFCDTIFLVLNGAKVNTNDREFFVAADLYNGSATHPWHSRILMDQLLLFLSDPNNSFLSFSKLLPLRDSFLLVDSFKFGRVPINCQDGLSLNLLLVGIQRDKLNVVHLFL